MKRDSVTRPSPLVPRLSFDRLDAIVAAILFAAAFAYLALHPRNLGVTDEGLYLYEARRLLEGDLFYRDIYEIIPPGSHYLMALMFGLFGTSITVAKLSMAAVHAVTTAALYLAGRAGTVRPLLAACPALAYAALCVPVWPYASPHWVGVCLSVLLLLALIDAAREPSPRRLFVAGILAGLATLVQHQRGLVLGISAGALLVLRYVIDRRMADTRPVPLISRLTPFVAAFLLTVVPAFALMLASSGSKPMLVALVEHPLVHYGTVNRVPWGAVPILTAFLGRFTFPKLLKYLPAILLVEVGRIALDLVRRRRHEELRVLSALALLGAACAASVAYRPDFIHLGFIAPIFFVAAAECAEWIARSIDGRAARTAVAAVAVVVLGGLAVQLWLNLDRARALYPFSAETGFGRVDFVSEKEIELIRQTEQNLKDIGTRELFSYPTYPALYLFTRTRNPTPYQLLLAEYSPPGQIEHAAEILERRQVPMVVVFAPMLKKDDAVLHYLRGKYEPIDAKEVFWKRRPEGGE